VTSPNNTFSQYESGAHWQNLLAAIPHGIMRTDTAGIVQYGNPACHKILGYDDGELVGTSILGRITSKSDLKWLRELFGKLAKDQPPPMPLLVTGRTKNNEQIHFQVDWSHERDSNGKPIEWVFVLTDITDRRIAEDIMHSFKAMFDSFISFAPVGMALFDSKMRYVALNKQLAEVNGFNIEEHLLKRPSDILPGKLGVIVEEKFEHLLKTGRAIVTEEISGETLSQPGMIRHWTHSYFPILGKDQEPKGIGEVLIETTKTKAAEVQLLQSQKMEALGTLSGGIAHDFNNILYPIFINANVLLKTLAADTEDFEIVSDIIESAQRAKDLVSQILVFSNNTVNVKSVCDLVSIAKETIRLIHATVPSTINVKQKFPNEEILIGCDSSQVFQVLVSLLTNAEQAIAHNGKIEISLESVTLEGTVCFDGTVLHGNYARLRVTDDGVGLDEETLTHIFDPFFASKSELNRTGLGLSAVYGIVKNHDGGITVSTKPEKGATFTVFLPLTKETLEQSTLTPDGVPDNTGNESILFVDDVKAIRKSVRNFLERSGYSVTLAVDGQNALEIFNQDPYRFDLVITDQTMPNMSGDELAQRLLELRSDIPVILCTGHSESVSAKTSEATGISAFRNKPLGTEELTRVVREVLDQADSAAIRGPGDFPV
jgi:PAS domain S-box-containing protein